MNIAKLSRAAQSPEQHRVRQSLRETERAASSLLTVGGGWYAVTSDCRRAYASSVGSYSLQLHSYRILAPQLSAHLHSIKHFSERLHGGILPVIFKNLDSLRYCFSAQALFFCIAFLDHVKHLQIHARRVKFDIAQLPPQKIHTCML